jgi:hypothetical protein
MPFDDPAERRRFRETTARIIEALLDAAIEGPMAVGAEMEKLGDYGVRWVLLAMVMRERRRIDAGSESPN